MKYPLVSFGLTFLVFCVVAILLSFSFSKKNPKEIKLIPATIEIDSIMVNEASEVKKFSEEKTEKKMNLPAVTKEKQSKESEINKKQVAQKSSENSDPNSKNKVLILYGPLPKIPDHLRDEAFNSFAMARFYINKDGSSKVELIKPCSNPELNYLLLKSLAKWKFAESDKNSVQDIRVNFRVE